MTKRTEPVVRCPIRPGDACNLCYSGASGPENCGLVWLVRQDPELRERLSEIRAAYLADHPDQRRTELRAEHDAHLETDLGADTRGTTHRVTR